MKKHLIVGKEKDYYHDEEEYLQLESCPDGGTKCLSQRAVINECMQLSRIHIENKNYTEVISSLKKAFDSTFDLDFKPCVSCAVFFRNLIFNALKKSEKELEKMTSGIFRKKKYGYYLVEVRKMLNDMKTQIEKYN
jgi:hypothetical protein